MSPVALGIASGTCGLLRSPRYFGKHVRKNTLAIVKVLPHRYLNAAPGLLH